jgi:HORMA domain-containing protein
MTYTSVSTYTRTHTATHLADVILGSVADILGTLGIDATRVFADWDTDQRAISAWIAEGSLASVALECHQPDGSIAPIFEFPVSYVGTGEGDRKFTADRAALARFLAKLQSVPRGTVYRIFCSYNGSHSDQRGWGPGSRASVSGMRSYSFGTLAAGPHGSAGLRYFTK